MSKRLIIILLCVSLAFNLAVLGMFLYASATHKHPFHRPADRERRPDSEERYSEFTEANRQEIRNLRSDFMQKRRAFITILSKDTYDESEAHAAMEASLAAQSKLEGKLGEAMLELRSKMPADEARKLFRARLERLNRRHKPETQKPGPPDNPNTQSGETE